MCHPSLSVSFARMFDRKIPKNVRARNSKRFCYFDTLTGQIAHFLVPRKFSNLLAWDTSTNNFRNRFFPTQNIKLLANQKERFQVWWYRIRLATSSLSEFGKIRGWRFSKGINLDLPSLPPALKKPASSKNGERELNFEFFDFNSSKEEGETTLNVRREQLLHEDRILHCL